MFNCYLRPKPVIKLLSGGVFVYFLVQEDISGCYGFATWWVEFLYVEEALGRGGGKGTGIGRRWNS